MITRDELQEVLKKVENVKKNNPKIFKDIFILFKDSKRELAS